ncbi:MAG TPA: hypothetical protein DCP20_04045 [Coriobacteriia bacterium]|nr:hypothetical protein [Coriobacteriia bacterium]
MLVDDHGVALVTVLGIGVIISILAVTSYAIASQALHESVQMENDTKAFRAASSGLDEALSTFSEATAVAMDTNGPIVGSTPDGTYSLSIEDVGDSEWVLTSVGSGPDGTTETVQQRFYFINLWEMNLSTGSGSLMSGSSALHGTSSIVGPFYMQGDLNIQANMAVLEGPLFVRNGVIRRKNPNSWLGMVTEPIKVYCDGNPVDGLPAIPENTGNGSGKGTGVYVSTRVSKVPPITLPPIDQVAMEEFAQRAKDESFDNLMGSTGLINLETDIENDPARYDDMQPPNTATWSRTMANPGSSQPYKFIGPESGVVSDMGEGSTGLTIGNTSFGAWGSVNTTDGVMIAGPGPTGVDSYPANRWDDFAYNAATGVLYVSGTVFVDGPVTFNRSSGPITYVGNGTIVANGDIILESDLRPYGTNVQGENNEWALGLVTPGDLWFNQGGNNPMAGTSASNREALRDLAPNYAGAYYSLGTTHFTSNNMLVRGTVLSTQMDFQKNNCILVTNPLLPDYLPDSLPGAGSGILAPGLWTRG